MFTDAKLRSLKAKKDRYIVWDGKTTMGIRVGPKTKTFLFKYRNTEGKQRWMTIGAYPAISLSDARMKVAEARTKLDKGIDPADAYIQAKTAEREAETVAQLMTEYIEKHAKAHKRSWKEDKRILDFDVIPVWGKRKAKDITRRDVIKLLDKIVERGSPIQANRTLEVVRKMFNFALTRDIVESTPCALIPKPSKENRRDRVLSEGEIKSFWNRLDFAQMPEAIKFALKFQLLTGQRKGEVIGAEWADFDLKTKAWNIPGEKTKNGLPHSVPLSPQAVGVIGKIEGLSTGSRWLFPARYKKDSHIYPTSVGHMLLRSRKILEIDDPFTPHDLRRTMASHLAAMGVSRLVLGKLLNHSEAGIASVYDRHSYDKEKRQALEQWGRKLDEIITGKKDGKVIALKRK